MIFFEPIYDIHKSYLKNLEEGPFFSHTLPKRPSDLPHYTILGKTLASRVGVPAGPLLNSKWIALASALGYDILTYKTIRSQSVHAHPLPNVLFLDHSDKLLKASDSGKNIRVRHKKPTHMKELAITNSFGMPSMDRKYLESDLPKARQAVREDQLFVVSVTGSHLQERTFEDDCVYVASFAKEFGAEAIEINFSCPNVFKGEGALYLDDQVVYHLAHKVVQAIRPLPLIIKVGVFPNIKRLERTLCAASRAGVSVVCGINTLSMNVINENGEAALSNGRLKSGVCGYPILNLGLDFVRHACNIVKGKKLDLSIWGVGGIVLPEHFDHYLDSGAEAALTATGMMWNPMLANNFHCLNRADLTHC